MTMKRRYLLYFFCIIGLLIIIAAAFYVPQFLFETQDGFRERNVVVEKRDRLDITKLNLSYEKSLSKRMSSFSQGMLQGKKYYVAATEYTEEDYSEDNQELYNVVENIIPYSYSVMLMYQEGFLPEAIFYPFDKVNVLNALKRYVIYDEDFQNGAALMAWYVDLNLEGTIRLRILADTETGTIYYAQVDYPEKMKSYILDCAEIFIYNAEVAYYAEESVNIEYETDKAKQDLEGEIISYEKGTEINIYDESKGILTYEQKIKEFWKTYKPQEYIRNMLLSYDGSELEYKIEYYEQENRLVFGVTEIGRLIPDFAEK